jgi:membrane associated rhomboid family serine protease
VTHALIALNVLVFVFLEGMGTNDRFRYGFSTVRRRFARATTSPGEVTVELGDEQGTIPLQPTPGSVYLTLLTSMFMHGSLMQLLGNMLFLWIFDDNVEDAKRSQC